ncbi:MalK ABC-type sugar transport systems, ATPase components [Burkholderiaceae bacterium]|jgi:sn-glycerol 3-phosphate transport system ATP-binding protein
MTAVCFSSVSKSWDAATALHPTDLTLATGEFSVLLGPSGCGKTTTLRLIAGLESPTTGKIKIFDHDVTQVPSSQRGVSMVFQNYALFPHLSVAENIVFGLRVRRVPSTELQSRLKKVLDLLSLTAYQERKPGQLSGGQQQRVALARALVADSRLCLMDEPLSNLDAQLRQEMRHELRALQLKLGLSVVYVTHDQTEAMSMADRVVLLNGGRVEQIATPFEIYQRPGTLFAAQFIGSARMNILELEQGRIAGSSVAVTPPARAVRLGLRPEDIVLGSGPSFVVEKTEFTGADLLLHARVGSQMLAVRAQGKHALAVQGEVQLSWNPLNLHWFDEHGRRI